METTNVGRIFRKARTSGSSTRGVALVESALMLPLLLFLMLNAVNFGMYIYAWITVNSAARSAAEYAIYNGVAVAFSSRPSYSQINNVFQTDISTLPNKASAALTVTCNQNGNSCGSCPQCGGAGSCPATDPGTYAIYCTKVSYTYLPLFSLTLPVINLSLTVPPAAMSRQVVMRSMQ